MSNIFTHTLVVCEPKQNFYKGLNLNLLERSLDLVKEGRDNWNWGRTGNNAGTNVYCLYLFVWGRINPNIYLLSCGCLFTMLLRWRPCNYRTKLILENSRALNAFINDCGKLDAEQHSTTTSSKRKGKMHNFFLL